MRELQMEKGRQIRGGRGGSDTTSRPMAKVTCKSSPAVSRIDEPAARVDSYVRHNDGFGHNPNLK